MYETPQNMPSPPEKMLTALVHVKIRLNTTFLRVTFALDNRHHFEQDQLRCSLCINNNSMKKKHNNKQLAVSFMRPLSNTAESSSDPHPQAYPRRTVCLMVYPYWGWKVIWVEN